MKCLYYSRYSIDVKTYDALEGGLVGSFAGRVLSVDLEQQTMRVAYEALDKSQPADEEIVPYDSDDIAWMEGPTGSY